MIGVLLRAAWALFRPSAPYVAALALLWAGWTYLQSLRSTIAQQRTAIAAEKDGKAEAEREASQLKSHVRTRIDAERKARENGIEIETHLRKARAVAATDADRLREYRSKPVTATVSANPADQPANPGTCEPAGPAAGTSEPDRSREIEQACALTSQRHRVLREYVIELDRALTEAQAAQDRGQ